MMEHINISSSDLKRLLRRREIRFGGNKKLKIFGTLTCPHGKRMKPANRVFFLSALEALKNGYRPCGHCLKKEYRTWKHGPV